MYFLAKASFSLFVIFFNYSKNIIFLWKVGYLANIKKISMLWMLFLVSWIFQLKKMLFMLNKAN